MVGRPSMVDAAPVGGRSVVPMPRRSVVGGSVGGRGRWSVGLSGRHSTHSTQFVRLAAHPQQSTIDGDAVTPDGR
jgi:hypothetical protein